MVLITIVTGVYKPTYNVWGPHIGSFMADIAGTFVCCGIWASSSDLTVLPKPGMVVNGNHPKMAASVRLVNYYNLPRLDDIYIYIP